MVRFAERMNHVSSSVIRDLLKRAADPSIISFGGGMPAKDSFPVDEIRTITEKLLRDNPIPILQYGITEGCVSLRKAYLKHIAHPNGVHGDLDNVITLTGANQGLALAADVFLDPTDCVLVESPTFLTTLMIFKKLGVRIIPVEVDDHGILIEDLEQKIKDHRPKMLYTIPTFHNPTGRTIPVTRRRKIAELASAYDIIVLEDDPYCDLRYSGERMPSIKSFDTTGHVVLLNSFSKNISPGLRVGTMLADAQIIPKMVVAKQCIDTHTPNLSQAICAEFLNQGLLPGHLKKIIPFYSERMNTMLDGIRSYFPKECRYSVPEGGLFIWVKLPNGMDAATLLEASVTEIKVAFVPGSAFFIDPQDGADCIRMNFSSNTKERIDEGLKRLGAFISAKI